MKHTFFSNKWLILFLFAAAFGGTSCIKEDLDTCYRLVVTVWNNNGDEITEAGDVQEAALFIFDENEKFLEKVMVDRSTIQSRQAMELNYPAGRQLKIVGWGGTLSLDKRQKFSELGPGSTIQDLKMTVLTQNDGNATPPDKLYYGTKLVDTKSGGEGPVYEVPIREKMSRVMVATEGFQYVYRNGAPQNRSIAGTKAGALDGYEVYVKRVPGGCDYKGENLADEAVYNPDKELDDTGELASTVSNFLPSNTIQAQISRPDGTTDVRDTDDDGQPFQPVVGQTLVIRLIYSPQGTLVSCKTEIRPWGYGKEQIIEF